MNTYRSGKMLSILALLVLVFTTLPAALAQQVDSTSKIEGLLLGRFAAEGRSDFLVRFAAQADLSPAYSMDWGDRGWFVYNTLKETAARSQGRAQQLLQSLGLKYQSYFSGNEIYVWGGTLDAASALAAMPEVYFVRAPRTYYIDPVLGQTLPRTPSALDWGILDTHADDFWSTYGVQGDGMVVANIDTGVQWNHPALDQAFRCPGAPSDPACWADPSNICGGSACDNNGHGTHTMGTMVGDDDPSLQYQVGMAPNAQWIACKGCESDSCSEYALNTCADWILQPGGSPSNRPNVVNNSWGGLGDDPWYLAKVQAWRAAGIFPAFSVGNSGPTCSSLSSPADYQESFGSAAHDSSRGIASFSARGPSAFGHDPYTKPNISAPGVNVCSSVPTNSWSCAYSGTSMASPHTAGAVALLWSCNPGLIGQIDLTFQALQDSADPPPPGSCGAPPDGQGNYTFGYGYLNVHTAGQQVCSGMAHGYLDGHVYDAGTGRPIAGATVTVAPGSQTHATTDPLGYYSMTLVVGTYDVTAVKAGYSPQTIQGVVVQTDTVTTQDIYLTFLGAWTPGPGMCFDLMRLDAGFYPGRGKVYVLGGRYGSNTLGDILAFDPVAGTCVDTGANMPTPISNYTINLVNDGSRDLLCTFGGRSQDGTATPNVQCYDPVLNTVSVVATLPPAYDGYVPGAQVVLNNKVYLFGGLRTTTTPYTIARTDRYDPVTHAFTQLGNLSLARSYLFAAVVDGAIYALGGDIYDGASLVAQVRTEKMADPEGAGTWNNAAVAELPSASGEGRAWGYDSDADYPYAGQIVLAGGGQWPGETSEALLYDVPSNSYDLSFPNLITARRDHGGVLVPLCSEDPADGLPAMWVFGGRSGSDSPPHAPAEFFPLPCQLLGPPHAAFTADPAAGCAPLTVQFNDQSRGNPPLLSWSWDFGDGFTSTVQNPTHTYSLANEYTVLLAVENLSGTNAASGTISAQLVPEAGFRSDSPVCLGQAVVFTNTSLHASSYLWAFGDGTTSTLENPTRIYVQAGSYTATLTATNDCSSSVASAAVVVRPLPEAGFTSDSPICLGQAMAFVNTSLHASSYLWVFGDGITSTVENPTHTYSAAGTYTVTLLATGECGTDATSAPVVVGATPLAEFSWVPQAPAAGEVITFTGTASGLEPFTYTWDMGDGTRAAGPMVSHAYGRPGTYTVTMTVTNPCGPAVVIDRVAVACDPVSGADLSWSPSWPVVQESVTFTGAALPPTATQPLTFSWDLGDGAVGSGAVVTHSYAAGGEYLVVLTVTNSCGQAAAFDTVHVCDPVHGVGFSWLPPAPTVDGVVTFTAVASGTTPLTFTWDLGDGAMGSGAVVTHSYLSSDTYRVILTATNVCGWAGATHDITVLAVPAPGWKVFLPLVFRGQASH